MVGLLRFGHVGLKELQESICASAGGIRGGGSYLSRGLGF